MELIDYDQDTVTIKMNWEGEFVGLRSILCSVAYEYSKLDEEILNMTESEVNRLRNALRDIDDATGSRGRDWW
ncbi:MAG: hypothetical protein K0U41_06250 [Gammaproteobacteria bacterium]|nr:hypothetical protein [Gammaproteobacteria bacterium]